MADARNKFTQPDEDTPFGRHLKEVTRYLNIGVPSFTGTYNATLPEEERWMIQVQVPGRTFQGSLKLTLGCTRLMGPSGGDATPLDLLFDSDSAAVSDCFVHISTLRTNLKVNPIGLEGGQNLLSNKKRITQFGVRMKKLFAFWVRYVCAVRIWIQNVRDLDCIFSWTKNDVKGLFEQNLNFSFSPIFICGLYKCPIHLQLDKTQKCVKYFCSG